MELSERSQSKYVKMPVHAYFIFWLSPGSRYQRFSLSQTFSISALADEPSHRLSLLSLEHFCGSVPLLLHHLIRSHYKYAIILYVPIIFWEVFVQTMSWWWGERHLKINLNVKIWQLYQSNINFWQICIRMMSLGDKFLMIRTVRLISMALLSAHMHKCFLCLSYFVIFIPFFYKIYFITA